MEQITEDTIFRMCNSWDIFQMGKSSNLMRCCKAFYFSFFFEGFGIPPLEALSVGAKIIVAKSSCLPEIFGDSAYYINPYKTNVYLDNVLNRPRQSGEVILQKILFFEVCKDCTQ